MSLSLPNTRAPFLDENGNISRVWWRFLNDLFGRVGGGNATDLGSIGVLLNAAVAVIDSQGNLPGPVDARGLVDALRDELQMPALQSLQALRNRLDELEGALLDMPRPIPLAAPEAFIAPALLNAWVNFGGTTAPAGYYRDAFGAVRLRGLVKSGVIGSAICTLPAGYRPPYRTFFSVMSNDLFGFAYVDTNGDVLPSAGSNAYFSLDSITFRAAT